MKNLMLSLMFCVVSATVVRADEAAAAKVHPDSANWENLFSEDLSNAIYPKGIWSFGDKVLTATEDKAIYTKKEYENFVLDLEFKTEAGTNSGVFVYCSDLKNATPNEVEIQIADDYAEEWAKQPRSWQCAAIFGRQAATKSLVKKPGNWNRMTITCKGPVIEVALNGEKVNEINMKDWKSAKKALDGSAIPGWLSTPLAELPTKGHVGLQGKHAGKPIYFRNLKIKSLD